jgi:hypothetical protein
LRGFRLFLDRVLVGVVFFADVVRVVLRGDFAAEVRFVAVPLRPLLEEVGRAALAPLALLVFARADTVRDAVDRVLLLFAATGLFERLLAEAVLLLAADALPPLRPATLFFAVLLVFLLEDPRLLAELFFDEDLAVDDLLLDEAAAPFFPAALFLAEVLLFELLELLAEDLDEPELFLELPPLFFEPEERELDDFLVVGMLSIPPIFCGIFLHR